MILWTLLACVSSTGGDRVAFDAEVVATAPVGELDGQPAIPWIDDDTGFEVWLTEARIHVGPVYLWSGEPLLDPSEVGWLDLLVPRAYADADQFTAGFLRGEVVRQVEVDLLRDEVTPLGAGIGLAGPSRSGEVWLEPVGGDDTLVVEGIAFRDDLEVPFRGALTISDDWADVSAGDNPVMLRRLRGLLWDAELAEGGLVQVHVDARRFLAGARFDTLLEQEPDGDGSYDIRPRTPVGNALYYETRIVGDSGPWALRWISPEER